MSHPRPPTTRLEELSRSVEAVFREIDATNDALRDRTGLACPSGCGACCENPHIETTVLEMLPAAYDLLRAGEAEAFVERAGVMSDSGRCTFYEPEPGNPGRGRCGRYAVRAGICRLFAFATVRTRRGRELAACRVHKQQSPEAVQRVELELAQGGAVSDFPAAAARIAALDPAIGTTPRHINAALREALERVLMERELLAAERVVVPLFSSRGNDDDDDDDPPTTPNLPLAV